MIKARGLPSVGRFRLLRVRRAGHQGRSPWALARAFPVRVPRYTDRLMADSPKKFQAQRFQAPKGTRDFYPADLAVRRHIEDVWRRTSINHGFEEIDGPTFEHLDLYTHKSGPGIASELFQVFSGKDQEQVAAIKAAPQGSAVAPYALRPEFTPTLARMVAARAPELPRPIKWFAIPSHFRAESPQRGRLREFMQWNVDFIGDATPQADAEVIATAVAALGSFGLTSNDVKVRISNRDIVVQILTRSGVQEGHLPAAFALLDRRSKTADASFRKEAEGIGLQINAFDTLTAILSKEVGGVMSFEGGGIEDTQVDSSALRVLLRELGALDLIMWCQIDLSIVRGLAYYTGTVFEIIAEGERAIAGGGRYDKLIENFGGPSLPACGFGMGDVVLANILKDKGLLKPAEEYLPRPDAFVIATNDEAAAKVPGLVAELRSKNGLHVRQSYKTTRNVGKLLSDAGKCRARYAVILGSELNDTPPRIALKDLDSGTQETIELASLAATLRRGEHAL